MEQGGMHRARCLVALDAGPELGDLSPTSQILLLMGGHYDSVKSWQLAMSEHMPDSIAIGCGKPQIKIPIRYPQANWQPF